MSKFIIRRTANGRYLTFTPLGKHISGTAHREVETANAEIAGWVAGWNAGIERSPILRWSWDVEDAQVDRSRNGQDPQGLNAQHERAVAKRCAQPTDVPKGI